MTTARRAPEPAAEQAETAASEAPAAGAPRTDPVTTSAGGEVLRTDPVTASVGGGVPRTDPVTASAGGGVPRAGSGVVPVGGAALRAGLGAASAGRKTRKTRKTGETGETAVEDVRARLEAAQAGVVAALVAGGAPPAGFDEVRLAVQARSLLGKRRGIVARLRPDAAAAAGPRLVDEFAAYAAARTEPPPRYRADADDFADWLRARGILHDPAPAQSPRTRWPFSLRRR
ncbi:hypothetical protein [Nonomuraea sp. bgisy101]|uniref:hypothetical protein n=1 Tax=Nonomuraea sp. bgisy101 TaxID=3413784 RepID=UPI003D73CE4E